MALFLSKMLRRNAISNQLAIYQEKSRELADKRMDVSAFAAAVGDGIDPAEYASLGKHADGLVRKYLSKLPYMQMRAVEIYNSSFSFVNNPTIAAQILKIRQDTPGLDQQSATLKALELMGSSPFEIGRQAEETAMKEINKQLEKEIALEEKKLEMEQKKIEDQCKMLEKEQEALDQSIEKGIDKSTPKYC